MAAVTAAAEHDRRTRLTELRGQGEKRGEEDRRRGLWKPLIQINGKISRPDADRLTVIWHTINLVSLSLLQHPPPPVTSSIPLASFSLRLRLSPVTAALFDTVLVITTQIEMLMFCDIS